jgi:hypothetical protein
MSERHAAIRAWERHRLAVTSAELDAAALDIIATVAGDRTAGLLLVRERSGTEIWLIRLCGRAVRVAYSPLSARVMSVLPDRSRRVEEWFGVDWS